MANIELINAETDTKSNVEVIGVDNTGAVKKIPHNQFFDKASFRDAPGGTTKNSYVMGIEPGGEPRRLSIDEKVKTKILFKDIRRHYNTTITLAENKSNFRFLIFYHGAHAISSIISLDAIRHIVANPFDHHGSTDRTFILNGYANDYTDVLIDDTEDNKVRIDDTGNFRGVFMIEGIY